MSGGREWTADVELDEPAVRRLVGTQFPDVSLDGLRPFATGWDNALWVTGEGIAFRFPRRSIAVPGVEREIAVLPALAPRLPLPVPDPEWIGHRDDEYPWPFFGTRLLPGREIADAELDGARDAFGASLGRFLRALHDPAVRDALGGGLPHDPNERADMAVRVPKTRERLGAIERLGLWHAPGAAHAYLDEAETLPPPSETALVHGDLHVRHVLVGKDRMPSAVIDWGDVAIAEPSVDLSLYWSQLDGPARAAFRETYGPERLTPVRLLRARVLALFLDAALLAYAHDVGNAALERITREALGRTLAD
ncbi:MAG TPA: phosphotransferase [Candidatus Limnocylindrales bacterium]|nr:phosphotransferase [Candidatus Limnocylindrales bacterium]